MTPVTDSTAPSSASTLQGGTARVELVRVALEGAAPREDRVVVEAPLEFLLHHPALGGESVSFGGTMRTPGDDDKLVAGLLYGEGIVQRPSDLLAIETGTRRPNVVNVRLDPSVEMQFQAPSRHFSAGSSCGVCGTTSLDAAIARAAATRIPVTGSLSLATLLTLPARMRAAQSRFDDTGGIHATALFDFAGNLLTVTEDVGRHNAFDKLVGEALLAGQLPLTGRVVLLSGRASFELVQKALRAGVEVLAAIGAPSSLAVNLAATAGLTLIGFLRERHCNVYSHPARLT